MTTLLVTGATALGATGLVILRRRSQRRRASRFWREIDYAILREARGGN